MKTKTKLYLGYAFLGTYILLRILLLLTDRGFLAFLALLFLLLGVPFVRSARIELEEAAQAEGLSLVKRNNIIFWVLAGAGVSIGILEYFMHNGYLRIAEHSLLILSYTFIPVLQKKKKNAEKESTQTESEL